MPDQKISADSLIVPAALDYLPIVPAAGSANNRVTVSTLLNLVPGFATTATAAGTTTLTVASKGIQAFTGSTTQTVTLPVVTTLPQTGFQFVVINDSSGAVTVNSSGANAVQVMAANSRAVLTCILLTGTTAASWAVTYIPFVAGTLAITSGKTLTASNTLTLAGTDSTTQTFPSISQTIVGLTATQTLSAKTVSLTAAHGSDDTCEGLQITGLNAGATIAQWEPVYLGASSTWLLADANGSGTYPARGLAVAAYSNTNPASILTYGTVRNDAWNWTPGGAIYLSESAGTLTQTAPAGSGSVVQQVGFALTADIAFFDFNSTYITLA